MSAGRCSVSAIGYTQDALNVQLTHHQLNDAAATDKTSNTLLTGSYDFCVAKASLGYALNKGTGTTDSEDAIAGVPVREAEPDTELSDQGAQPLVSSF